MFEIIDIITEAFSNDNLAVQVETLKDVGDYYIKYDMYKKPNMIHIGVCTISDIVEGGELIDRVLEKGFLDDDTL